VVSKDSLSLYDLVISSIKNRIGRVVCIAKKRNAYMETTDFILLCLVWLDLVRFVCFGRVLSVLLFGFVCWSVVWLVVCVLLYWVGLVGLSVFCVWLVLFLCLDLFFVCCVWVCFFVRCVWVCFCLFVCWVGSLVCFVLFGLIWLVGFFWFGFCFKWVWVWFWVCWVCLGLFVLVEFD
jgi:hypothetical protein